MKKSLYILLFLFALVIPNQLKAQESAETIYIGTLSTTHILFATDLTYVDISKPDFIAAKVVDASKNMLAIKAIKEFSFTTTISALEANGTMHTFLVKYSPSPAELVVDTRIKRSAVKQESVIVVPTDSMKTKVVVPVKHSSYSSHRANRRHVQAVNKPVEVVSPMSDTMAVKTPAVISTDVAVSSGGSSNFGRKDAPTLEQVMRLRQQIFHVGDNNFNMNAYCINIFVYSDIIYLVFKVENHSYIGYEAGETQFVVENMKADSHSLATDKAIWAKSSFGSPSCGPKSSVLVGYTISKFTLLKNECLRVYIYEKSGNRNLVLTLIDKDLNYAIAPN
jgi:hypothetical protein